MKDTGTYHMNMHFLYW